jgi:hypothetical protein
LLSKGQTALLSKGQVQRTLKTAVKCLNYGNF